MLTKSLRISPFAELVAAVLLLPGSFLAQEQAAKPAFFLPKNPVAAAYVLGRLSEQELIDAPRGEYVYRALLERKGLPRKYHLEALQGLSQLHGTNPLTELLTALSELDKKGDDSTGVIRELVPLLLEIPAAELETQHQLLETLTRQASLPLTRQGAFAGLIIADGSIDRVWTNTSPTQLDDLVMCLPLLPTSARPPGYYSRIEPLLNRATPPELLRAAVTAVVAIPGHDRQTFISLVELVKSNTQTAAAVESLELIPQSNWPAEAIEPLAHALLGFLQSVPADQRTDRTFTTALRLANDLAAHLPAAPAQTLRRTLRGLGPAVFVIHAVYEQMRFDTQLIVVEPSRPVAITLENADAMPHNLAILAPGALEEIGLAAEKMPPSPDAQGRLYVPASPKILAATRLVPPGQKLLLAFTAPAEPGEYPYVCTFPGHWRRMTGAMVVAEDPEAYIAGHAHASQPQLTEWKFEDLAPELAQVTSGRNLSVGAELFTKLACVQCHKLGDQGYAYGPELTDVFQRYKNDRGEVLRQILEPSKVIADRYRVFEFELNSGDTVSGMVLKEDQDSLVIQAGASDSLIQTLKKSDIRQKSAQKTSPMPLGLLNTLSKEQILDLLAFLEAGGRSEHHLHAGGVGP